MQPGGSNSPTSRSSLSWRASAEDPPGSDLSPEFVTFKVQDKYSIPDEAHYQLNAAPASRQQMMIKRPLVDLTWRSIIRRDACEERVIQTCGVETMSSMEVQPMHGFHLTSFTSYRFFMKLSKGNTTSFMTLDCCCQIV